MRGARLAIAIAVGGLIWHLATREPSEIRRDPGILAPDEPIQIDLPAGQESIAIGKFTLTPLAEFSAEARLLRRKRYRWDEGAVLSPLDFGIAWGRLSDSAVIDQLSWSQSARFLSYRWSEAPPVPQREVDRSVANVHLIPADRGILRQLDKIAPGQVLRISGLLVEAKRPDGWSWRSSLTRTDTGRGACELLLVQSVEVLH